MPAPFDLTRFHSLLRTRAFGRNLIFEPTVGSTMDVARDAAHRGAPEGTVAVADEQTAGRGRMGRSWLTLRAVNLASTMVLRPPSNVLHQVAMITPLAICHAVEDVASLRCDIKWPNDVQVGGKKLAGVLIETEATIGDDAESGGRAALPAESVEFALVGAGINVNFNPNEFPEVRDIATSLLAELGRQADREALLAAYLAHFERLYDAAKAGAPARAAWRERLVTLGRRVHAAWPGGEASGVAEDVDEGGSLIVRTADGGTVTVDAGDVTLRE